MKTQKLYTGKTVIRALEIVPSVDSNYKLYRSVTTLQVLMSTLIAGMLLHPRYEGTVHTIYLPNLSPENNRFNHRDRVKSEKRVGWVGSKNNS